jgi:hypothetical protein
MTITDQILQLPKEEKLKVMEALWADLSSPQEEFEPPKWHRQVLQNTKEKFDRGEIEIIDWEDAKRQLRE